METKNFHITFILKFQHALAVCGVVTILGFTSCAIPVSRVFECGRQAETLGHGLKPPAWSWPFRPKMLRNLCGAGSPWGTDGCLHRRLRWRRWLTALLLWGGEARGSGALGGAARLPLHHHRLLAAQDGAGSADGSHAQIRAVLVLPDHVPDAAEGGPGVLVDGGPHVGSGWLALAWQGTGRRGGPRVSGRVWNVGAHTCCEGRIPPRDTECLGRVSAGGCLVSQLHVGHIHRDDHRPGSAPIQVCPPYPSPETTLLSSLDKGGLSCVRSHVHSSRLSPTEAGTWRRTGQAVSAPQKAALLLSRPHPPRPKRPQSGQQSPKGRALRPGP